MTEQRHHWFRGKGIAALWAGWVLGPVAWALHENIGFFGLYWICAQGGEFILHLTTVAALVLAGAGGMIAWWSFKRAGGPEAGESEGGGAIARSRFMAIAGLGLSAISALGILVESIPVWMMDPCSGVQ